MAHATAHNNVHVMLAYQKSRTSSDGSLVAYEYGLRKFAKSSEALAINISPGTWDSFAQEFSAYVRSAGIAEIVSLKEKGCINGGEYVVPSMRVLFRVPMEEVNLQPGSENARIWLGIRRQDGTRPRLSRMHRWACHKDSADLWRNCCPLPRYNRRRDKCLRPERGPAPVHQCHVGCCEVRGFLWFG
ncbi:hypothetical protein V8C26DRAFT_383635 [Trichoderma gracile]